jgi:hypothetical protein
MKYGIYKNEWSSADTDPFTVISSPLVTMKVENNAFHFYNNKGYYRLIAVYPMSAFYVVVLED